MGQANCLRTNALEKIENNTIITTHEKLCYRGILVYSICFISISNSVSDGATNKSVLNIESS